MSLKSPKSINEECSEIIEKSYSVKSASDESISGDDEDECLARELMNRMNPAILSKLRRCFRKSKEKAKAHDIDRRVEEVMRAAAAEEGIDFAAPAQPTHDTLWLNEQGFVEALDNIFGHHKYTTHSHKLFHLLDCFGTGRVWWRQLVSRLVAVGAKKTNSRAEAWTPVVEHRVLRLQHCKRETIVKLVTMEREESFCYVAVSRGGRVGIYSGLMSLLHEYQMFYHLTGVHGRIKNRWVTDAIFMPDVHNLLISASDRSLTIYDVTTLSHNPLFCITGLLNIPTCLAYSPSPQMGAPSELAIGSERGDVTRLKFLQPRIQLLHSKTPDGINYYFWRELTAPPHTTHCTVYNWKKVHSRSVRRLAYSRNVLLSCSHDAAVSVRIRRVDGKMDDYTFKVARGVSCFHLVSSLHMVATGGCDGTVRLWQIGTTMPFATLPTPTLSPVLDIVAIPPQEIVIAYCNNCTVHIWDIYEECLLQSIKIHFPFLGVLGKKVEFGTYCIHPGPVRREIEELETEIPEVRSRRGSSVFQGSTGGLMLKLDLDEWASKKDDESEYSRFNRSELQLSCCDYICTVHLAPLRGEVLRAPADTLTARTPAEWDLARYPAASTSTSPRSPHSHIPHSSRTTGMQLLSPSTAETPQTDLDTLLKNAGLEGILEKDFVLMQGLKHDLNRKLAEMEANKDVITSAVNVGAPYLALKTYDPIQIDPVDEMRDEYRRIMKLFPKTSVTGTPAGSEKSTPRNKML